MKRKKILRLISQFSPMLVISYFIIAVIYLNLSPDFDLSQLDRASLYFQFLSVSVVFSVFLIPITMIFKGVFK